MGVLFLLLYAPCYNNQYKSSSYQGVRNMFQRLASGILISLVLYACAPEVTVNEKEVMYEIKKGMGFSTIARDLKEKQVIRDVTRFRAMAKLMRKDKAMKVGLYTIQPGESYRNVILKFSEGKTHFIKVTIPEGYSSYQIAELLSGQGFTDAASFLSSCKKPEYLERYGIPQGQSLEGYLYPDTYYIPLHYKADDIISMMLKRFDEVVDERVKAKLQEKGLTLHKLLSMAAIVEKEARVEFEKPIIAGVYYRRLKTGMRLQADPTLIYALILDGEYDGDIKFKHLRPPWPSPYNTYYVYGLPPGPIANPGKSSILAALFPADVDYVYFVANPADGTHVFARTLEEHNLNVKKYQKRK